jgi:hypothetical protein
MLRQFFAEAGIEDPEIVSEDGEHPIHIPKHGGQQYLDLVIVGRLNSSRMILVNTFVLPI